MKSHNKINGQKLPLYLFWKRKKLIVRFYLFFKEVNFSTL